MADAPDLTLFHSTNLEDRVKKIEKECLNRYTTYDNYVDIIGYQGSTSGGVYVFPSDGYIRFVRRTGSTADIQFDLGGMNLNVPPNPSTNVYFRYGIYVRKGLRFYLVSTNIEGLYQVYFYPLRSD